MIELRQLRAFVAVAEEGTFVAAADRLGVVQPAVSQAVRRLESELELVLFERSSRRVSLTGPGAAFLPEARAVLTRLAQAEQTARDLAVGRSGLVRMATTPGAPGLVRALLSHQRAAHPDVHVEIVATQQSSKLRAILDGDIDVALTHSAPATPGLAFTEVWREPWVPVVSAAHPLACEKHVTLGALAAHPLVLVAGDGTSNMTEQFVAVCGRAGFEPTLGRSYANLGDALVEIARSTGWTMLRASNTRNVGDLGSLPCRSTTIGRRRSSGSRTAAIPRRPPARSWRSPRGCMAAATSFPTPTPAGRRNERGDASHIVIAARSSSRLPTDDEGAGIGPMTSTYDEAQARRPETVLRRYVDAVEAGDESTIRELFADDATWTLRAGDLPSRAPGRGATRSSGPSWPRRWRTTNRTRSRWRSPACSPRATGSSSSGPAVRTRVDGRPYENGCIGVFTVRDGRIQAVREYMDTLYASQVLR